MNNSFVPADPQPSTRRQFLATTAIGSSVLILPKGLRGQGTNSPNERLRIAQVGVGGRGRAALAGLADEQIVAFCDVDEKRGREAPRSDKNLAPVFERGKDARMMAVTSHSASARLLPEERMKELANALPAKTIPRVVGGPFKEWTAAIRGGPACGSNFDYSAALTEVVLLGVAAQRAQARLQWDAKNARFTNRLDANVLVGPGYEYRAGWGV